MRGSRPVAEVAVHRMRGRPTRGRRGRARGSFAATGFVPPTRATSEMIVDAIKNRKSPPARRSCGAAFDSRLNCDFKLDDRDTRRETFELPPYPYTPFLNFAHCASEKLNGKVPPAKKSAYYNAAVHTIQTDAAEATLKDSERKIRISTGEICQPSGGAARGGCDEGHRVGWSRARLGAYAVPVIWGNIPGVGEFELLRTVKAPGAKREKTVCQSAF